MIKRNLYLNQFMKKEHNSLIKVITKIKRCGKSYLLFNMFYSYLIVKVITLALDEKNIKHSNSLFLDIYSR